MVCQTTGKHVMLDTVYHYLVCLPYVGMETIFDTPSLERRRCHDSMPDGRRTTAWHLWNDAFFATPRSIENLHKDCA